jgi:hypothetical protein
MKTTKKLYPNQKVLKTWLYSYLLEMAACSLSPTSVTNQVKHSDVMIFWLLIATHLATFCYSTGEHRRCACVCFRNSTANLNFMLYYYWFFRNTNSLLNHIIMGYKFFRLEKLMFNYSINKANFTDVKFVQTFYKALLGSLKMILILNTYLHKLSNV